MIISSTNLNAIFMTWGEMTISEIMVSALVSERASNAGAVYVQYFKPSRPTCVLSLENAENPLSCSHEPQY